MHQVEIATTQETLLDSPEMVLNMGPQHPSTHGVLRVILKLDGETVIDLDCDIGYLHRGMEKIAENRMYTMIAPYWDRLDYIAAVSNGLVWVETVEQMMGLAVPPRAHYLRTILTELNRIASHLLWLATHALDIGAVTVLLWALREREEILKIFERQFGARLTCHAWRVGGMPNDAYDDFDADVRQFVSNFPKRLDEYETVLSENRIWLSRTVGIGVISGRGRNRDWFVGSGVAWFRSRLGHSQVATICRLCGHGFRYSARRKRRHLRSLSGSAGRDETVATDHRSGAGQTCPMVR